MNIGIISEKNAETPSVLAIFVYEEENIEAIADRRFIIPVIPNLTIKNFKAELGSVIDEPRPMWHTVIIGLGKRKKRCADSLRDAAAVLPKHLKELSRKTSLNTKNIGVIMPDEDKASVQAVVEGFLNGLYEFNEFKTEKSKNALEIDNFYILSNKLPEAISPLEPSLKAGKIIAEAVHLARDLGNTPANILTPTEFMDKVLVLKEKRHCWVNVFNDECLEKKKLNCILAVGSGSNNTPGLVMLNYAPPDYSGAPIVLIGKGLTFDSGGISIKPSQGMEEMKYDMAGAATVLATVKAISELELPTRVIAVMPLAENKPAAGAMRPGDIIKSYSGKTIEVANTDAEGRLLLADACSFAVKNLNPSAIITVATLTGACIIAAGNVAAGLMGNDKNLVDRIKIAGERVGEKVQTFELFPEYKEQIKSKVADIKNIGGREAGVITAAMFIQEFLEVEGAETPKWAHLDIAGTAFIEAQTPKKNYFSPGATGWGVRLLIEFLRQNFFNFTR